MSDSVRSPEAAEGQSLIQRPLSRRQVLRGGLVAGGAAFLAACGAAATPAPRRPRPPATAAPARSARPRRSRCHGRSRDRRPGNGCADRARRTSRASSSTTSPAAT